MGIMKDSDSNKWAILFCLPVIFLLSITNCDRTGRTANTIDYFGQEPPGLSPKIFAPGILSEAGYRLHCFPAFSPDGKEVFWSVIPPKILYMKNANGVWSAPETAPFSQGNINAPSFSPDGSRLYFQAARPEGFGSLDIWYVEKTETGWSSPVNAGQPVNSEKLESQPSVAENGNLYFTGYLENVALGRGIYVAKFTNGGYTEPEILGDAINTEGIEYTPFIAPDESCLLFASSRPGTKEKDLRIYVSFHNNDKSWANPVNINEYMGFDAPSRFPYISPDGKYLFFYSSGNIYWIDSKIIEFCKPD